MPLCRLTKIYRGVNFAMYSPGVLLKEGDRYSVIDPSNNNELISGMTEKFKDMLIERKLLEIIE